MNGNTDNQQTREVQLHVEAQVKLPHHEYDKTCNELRTYMNILDRNEYARAVMQFETDRHFNIPNLNAGVRHLGNGVYEYTLFNAVR